MESRLNRTTRCNFNRGGRSFLKSPLILILPHCIFFLNKARVKSQLDIKQRVVFKFSKTSKPLRVLNQYGKKKKSSHSQKLIQLRIETYLVFPQYFNWFSNLKNDWNTSNIVRKMFFTNLNIVRKFREIVISEVAILQRLSPYHFVWFFFF